MSRLSRTLIAMGVCLSGWALLPFASLPAQGFSWALYAEAYELIFGDDFSQGTSRWSVVVGEVLPFLAPDPSEHTISFRLDPRAFGEAGESQAVVLRGLTPKLRREVFAVEARRVAGGFTVRLQAARAGGAVASPWRWVPADHQVLTLEWRRSYQKIADGYLYLSVDGQLYVWLVDLDNHALPLGSIGVSQLLEHRLGAVDLSGRNYGTLTDPALSTGAARD